MRSRISTTAVRWWATPCSTTGRHSRTASGSALSIPAGLCFRRWDNPTNNREESHAMKRYNSRFVLVVLTLLGLAAAWPATADEVTDWNQNMLNAVRVANTLPAASPRVMAIVQAAVF